MAKVLLVDDEPGVLFTLEQVLQEHGLQTLSARSGAEALAQLPQASAVVTDLAMPGMDGLALLQAVREQDPTLPVVLLTAHGNERVAVQAMRAGAYDYLPKPFDNEELLLTVQRALEARAGREAAQALALERAAGRSVVGQAPAFLKVLAAARRLASRDIPVLVRGETGTGKELIASLLHAGGTRAAGPLVRFNCAAIPAELAEAELFGHAKGAFTGAVSARRGYLRQAHGGTLVLDEVGELPQAVQPKLLRALQDGEVQPVGESRTERVDLRVVACTHRDLAEEVRAGRFREDLYYRLNVVELVVPPLRERREDVPLLAEEFCRRYAQRFGLEDARLTPGLLAALQAREWPGNVRELENCVARMLALSSGGPLGVEALEGSEQPHPVTSSAPLREQLAAFERELLARTLESTQGNQSEAARRLGLTRVTLIDRLKRHGLHKNPSPPGRGTG
ncbi:MAG TPA: sigma-54 dependent transcriptional regulator [Aggregicoccus sp.]|nr:sigma-54 dependent transcriptional regulator [Aggregicoccus sp.]